MITFLVSGKRRSNVVILKWVFSWEWGVVKMASELILTLEDLPSGDVSQGNTDYYWASRVSLSQEIALPGQVRVDWQGLTFAIHAIMAPLWFLGFGWASSLVWAKVVGPTKYTTAHDVLRSKAQQVQGLIHMASSWWILWTMGLRGNSASYSFHLQIV